ncbi:GumC family protein [Hymenobacter actinosclerus]|uniref:non-specific protein-tyrosine kinase n=1 Tax=Hymenobacter actinosclerus TaxID=82805 RepID=A0A1H9ZSN3_9BACT|nr:polysaccharide biosynthesis tyrosine autokinase [Hymenobacter actinosclerus]SES84701.1 capsular exopolysaccharide family [Hymenobacter actinosclerus]
MAAKEDAELEELIRNAGGEPEEEDDGGGLDLTTLLTVARRSLPWMVLLVVLGLTASWLFLRYTPPLYKSTSTLKIDEKTEAGVLGLGSLGGAVEQKQSLTKLSGEIELIKSDIIYSRLNDSLALDVNYYVQGTVLETEIYGSSPFEVSYEALADAAFDRKIALRFLSPTTFELTLPEELGGTEQQHTFGQPFTVAGFRLTIRKAADSGAAAPEGQYSFMVNSPGALSNYFNSNLLVDIVNVDANTISISFTDHNPAKARDIVNAVDAVYLEEKLARKREQSARALRYINEQLGSNNQSLSQAEEAMEAFVKRTGSYDVKGEVGQITGLMQELEEERAKLQEQGEMMNDVGQLLDREQLTTRADGDVMQSIPALAEVKDAQLVQRITELSDAQLDLKRALLSYQPGATLAMQTKEQSIADLKKIVRQLLRKNQQLLKSQEAKLLGKRAELEAKLRVLPDKYTEQARLQRPLELFEKYNLMMLDKRIEFGISMAGATADFQILSPASPAIPISPVKFIIYAIGLAAGIVLGLGLIAVRYLLHNTVTNIRELERNTHAPVLGVIPTYDKEKMAVSKLVVDRNPKSALSEAIRSIRTNLEFVASSKRKRLISVTSTISGEGKTFVTVNLAGIIAASDQRVVILDLDMRKPKVNLAFDAENIKGVSTILIEKHTWQECVQHTSIPTLDFISAGPTPPNPSELILSDMFDPLIAELHQHYDVIIIDTPPVGLVTDGILIMRKADVPIYVVRANYSKKSFLKNINKLIRTNGFTKLTTILNDAQTTGGYGYGYGYGYSYGQGYYDEDNTPKDGLLSRLRQRIS